MNVSFYGHTRQYHGIKGEIDAKIKKNGVDKFTLDVVDTDAQAEGKVVGTCDGGTKKIVYKRGG